MTSSQRSRSRSRNSPSKAVTASPKEPKGVYEQYMAPAFHFLMFNIPPGPNCIPLCYVINFFKGMTLPWCFYLMYSFNNWSYTAYTMTALHGSYGMLWCVKHFIIPDTYWFEKATVMSVLLADAPVLSLYWSASYLTISRHVVAPPHRIFASILLYVFGVVLMLCADTQKYFVLQIKKGLIDNGWFAFSRNTNYLGEMMLYGSFSLLAKHPFPMYMNLFVWVTLFAGRWAMKEASFAKKDGGKEYIARSSYILPTNWWALVIYCVFGYYFYAVY